MSDPVRLKIGADPNTKLPPGASLDEQSMAAAIEAAMNTQVPRPASEDPTGRRRLALAIAAGVIQHLQAKHEAFVVDVRDDGGTAIDRHVRIEVD